jgi:leucyl aminopeptidase
VNISFVETRPGDPAIVVIPVGGETLEQSQLATLGEQDRDQTMRAAASARFELEAGTILQLFPGQADTAKAIVLLGIGKDGNDADLEKAGGALSARFLASGDEALVINVTGLAVTGEQVAHLLLGAVLRAWRCDEFRTRWKPRQKPSLNAIIVVGAASDARKAWTDISCVADGVAFARELVTLPANVLYPESFVERCRKLADLGVEITVLDDHQMADLGMGALLGVAQGSRRPARLLVMRWKGADADPVAFVGKGVTFDTGGISIKPAAGMEDMKWDMGGAAAVAGAMMALAGRKAKAHVIGVCGLVENMPDGNAQRPGDVVTSMSGQTIEVINTDAEGRLVLCDAITWVQKTHNVKTIVDLATLTGAIIVTLGHEQAGLFANDDALAEQLMAAGAASRDKLWRLPLGDAYDKLIDSAIADMKNSCGAPASSITAAHFIKRHVADDVRWAHLDIAGTVWTSTPGATWNKGATGFGVRLLDRFAADALEQR